MGTPDTSRISPTAHYTGYVWYRHGLSPAALATPQGMAMFRAVQPLAKLASFGTGGVTLETFLIQRHRIIDHLLGQAIESGAVRQVVELAGGLSGRGLRFMKRYAAENLIYVEGDLPGMAERKQRLLAQTGGRRAHHHVIAINALATDGPQELKSATGPLLSSAEGTAIVTEGLLNYFDRDAVDGMWSHFSDYLSGYARGLYLTDIHLADSVHARWVPRAFVRLLSVFAAGRIHLHFGTKTELEASCQGLGFGRTVLHRPSDFAAELDLPRHHGPDHTRVLEAWTQEGPAGAPGHWLPPPGSRFSRSAGLTRRGHGANALLALLRSGGRGIRLLAPQRAANPRLASPGQCPCADPRSARKSPVPRPRPS